MQILRSLMTTAVLLTVLRAGVFAAPAPGASTYDIFLNGSRIGTERVEWSVDELGRSVLAGDCVRDVDGVSAHLSPRLVLAAETLAPVEYSRELNLGGEVQSVEGRFDGGRVQFATLVDGTSSRKTLKIRPADMVVDGHVLSLYAILAQRYDAAKGGEQDVTVFDVATGKSIVAHAMMRGLGTFESGGQAWRLRRLTLNLEDVAVDLLIDDAGQVPQVSVPLRGMEARLQHYNAATQAARINPGS